MKDLIVNGNANLPAHAQASGSSNLAGDMVGAGYPRLTFKGSRFRIKLGGDERVLGVTELPVVVLEANPHVSRVYYAGAYDPETATRPDCASEDGVTPLPSVEEPQSSKCATCPQNEKGSAVTDTGGKTRACSYFKRVAVLLADEPELGPLVADMKAMSMFGRSYPDKGAFSLRDYAKRLEQNKVMPHAVVTSLEFDTNESVPKLLFRAVDYTSLDFHEKYVEPLLGEGELEQMVRTSDMNTGEIADDEPKDTGFRDKLLEGSDPKAEDDEDDEEEEAPKPKAKKKATKKKAKKKAEKKPEPEPEQEEEEEDEDDDAGFDDELEDALAEFGFND